MGCGCGKKRAVMTPPATRTRAPATAAAAKRSGSVKMFDVINDSGSLVASFSNPATARSEARRVGGNVVPRNPMTSTAPAVAE